MTDPFNSPGKPGVTAQAGTLTLETFLDRFPEIDEENDGYAVTCPNHSDRAPSLRVAYNPASKALLLKCRAGCTKEEVLDALGLQLRDLFNVEPGNLANVRATGATPIPVSTANRAALAGYLHSTQREAPGCDEVFAYADRRFGISASRFTSLGLGYDDTQTKAGRVILSRDLYHDAPRLVVPFNDLDGNPHYLQARAITPDYSGRAKWSGPANPDGETWGRFGWFPGDTGWNEIVLTEGPGDGLTTSALGYDTLLIRGAALGLTDALVDELARRFPDRRFILGGDNDNAGTTFNNLAGEKLTAKGLTTGVLVIPNLIGDISEWREKAPQTFSDAFASAVRAAAPWVAPAPAQDAPATPQAPDEDEARLHRTELGNARRLHRRLNGLVRYTSALGFLIWDGAAWVIDYRNRVQAEAASSAEEIMNEALAMPRGEADSPIEKARKAALRWAHDSQRRNGLDAAVQLLKSLPGVSVAAHDLDSHPHLLAARNGTINLRTGKLQEADPKDLLTKALSIDYVEDAKAPRWDQFLGEVFPKSPGTQVYLQRLVGYGITGENAEQCFVLLHGHGANGKSVFTSALYDVFSSITANTGIETFLAGEAGTGSGPSADVAALRGARLALTSESEHGARLAEAKLKRLTGGDPVQARHLYREPFTFTPTFLLFMSTNGLPEIRGTDDGIWRRIKVLEWAERFYGKRRDKTLPDKLRKEKEGILAWAVRGAVDWYTARDGGTDNALAEPKEVEDRTNAYRVQSDKLDGFYPGRIVEDEDGWMPRGKLYSIYQEWAEAEGSDRSQMWRNTTLYSHFRSIGVEEIKRNGIWGFIGLRPERPSDNQDSPAPRANDHGMTDLSEETLPPMESFTP